MESIQSNSPDIVPNDEEIAALKTIFNFNSLPIDDKSVKSNPRSTQIEAIILQLFLYGSIVDWKWYINMWTKGTSNRMTSLMEEIYAYIDDSKYKPMKDFSGPKKTVYDFVAKRIESELSEFNSKKNALTLKNLINDRIAGSIPNTMNI